MPPGGMAGAATGFLGFSVTAASVVISNAAALHGAVLVLSIVGIATTLIVALSKGLPL